MYTQSIKIASAYTQLFLKTTMEMYIFGNVKEQMYTITSRDNYGNVHVWKCQRMNVHCNFKRQLWKYICLEISKNRCTLLFQETTMEMYMFGNVKERMHTITSRDNYGSIKERMYTTVSRDNNGNLQVWK